MIVTKGLRKENRCQFHQHLRAAFCTKVLRKAFLYLDYRFKLFLSQEYWCKCAHKMLVKLTIEVGHQARKKQLKNVDVVKTIHFEKKRNFLISFTLQHF
jgi:hypothetical protein